MSDTLLKLLALSGILASVTAQFVFEHDLDFHNPFGSKDPSTLNHYIRYDNYYTQRQCPWSASFKGTTLSWCKMNCDQSAWCSAFNYINQQRGQRLMCSLKFCPNNTKLYPIGEAKGVHGYLKISKEEPIRFEEDPSLVYNETSVGPTHTRGKHMSRYVIHYDHSFARRQCPMIDMYIGRSLDWCQNKCDSEQLCSAFNYKTISGHHKLKCSLWACGDKPPYPVGTEEGWLGHSRKKIKKGFTHYYGPNSKIWNSKQPCAPINPLLKNKTYVECENECNLDKWCTGFNFNLKNFDCQRYHCNDISLRPIQSLDGWESWSKYALKAESMVHYYKYAGLTFTRKQCSYIGYYTGRSITWCQNKCDTDKACNAINYFFAAAENGKCYLWSCGSYPPYPIGNEKDGDGYSKEKIIKGFTKYHGPHSKIWELEKPCDYMDTVAITEDSYTGCEDACDIDDKCTGFNFNLENFDCRRIQCNDPSQSPNKYLPGWESWSKTAIKDYDPWIEYDHDWGNWQCLTVMNWGAIDLKKCKEYCENDWKCNAFNHDDHNDACTLLECSIPPPYPKGRTGRWYGYSLYAAKRCPDGFFFAEGSTECFKIYDDDGYLATHTWDQAKAICSAKGHKMASPTDEAAPALRKYLVDRYGGMEMSDSMRFWIGARGDGSNMVWKEDNNKVMKSTKWHGSRHKGHIPRTNCAYVLVSYHKMKEYPKHDIFDIGYCGEKHLVLCEAPEIIV